MPAAVVAPMVAVPDAFDVGLVHRFPGNLLGAFNAAGVLAPADVHIALRLARMASGTGDPVGEAVTLAVALAVRAPRVGHVFADLRTVRSVVAADIGDDVDLDGLPWPPPEAWVAEVAGSALVALGDGPAERPVRLVGSSLYLDRYWRDELDVAADLRRRAGATAPVLDADALVASLDRLFGPGGDPDQRQAAALAAGRRLSVVAGGPGTGKTTTVARVLAVLHDQAAAAGARAPLVALAAPTGKAAARLEEAVRREAADLPGDPDTRRRMTSLSGSTLHRLLGSRRGSASFRHHAGHRLPHDVIVVDEASMVSLGLMARLVEAVRPDARLVLVGDPQQLVSVEAGAVLADIVAAAGGDVGDVGDVGEDSDGHRGPLADVVSRLRTNHRAGGTLAALAGAVRDGDEDTVVGLLTSGDPALRWIDGQPADDLTVVRAPVEAWATELAVVARGGDPAAALGILSAHRVLCAHRGGAAGVRACNAAVATWVDAPGGAAQAGGAWHPGRPVLVTANDYSVRLFNGDTGVAVAGPGGTGVGVAFGDGSTVRTVSPSRLPPTETVFAMTVHKSQGSEFDRVTLLLPPPESRLLTRELLYTAVTRARRHLLVAGTDQALRAALRRPIARASGLTARLS